jgi:hypothetical protein
MYLYLLKENNIRVKIIRSNPIKPIMNQQPPPHPFYLYLSSQKPYTIKTIGLFLMIMSGMIVLGNTMGLFAFLSMDMLGDFEAAPAPSEDVYNLLHFMISNYSRLCLFMIGMGILYFIGGLYLRQYKRWAQRLLTIVSLVNIVVLWAVARVISKLLMNELVGFSLFPVLFWTTIHGLFIWYLNKKSIRQNFD